MDTTGTKSSLTDREAGALLAEEVCDRHSHIIKGDFGVTFPS
jgi:hypothetical protein